MTSRRCNHPKKDGKPCTAWALTEPEPDGLTYRCTGHSEREDAKIRRLQNKVHGKVLGGRKKRSDTKQEKGEALEQHAEKKLKPVDYCPRCGYPTRPEPTWPEKMDLTTVTGPFGQNAWRQAVFKNQLSNAITEDQARTYTALIRDSASAKPPTPGDNEIPNEESPMGILRNLNRELAAKPTAEERAEDP